MTSLTLTTTAPPARRPFLPLVRADLLKLRKNRGIVFTAAALTIGTMVVAFGVLELLHAVNPDHHGPAGGISNLADSAGALAMIGSVAAVLIGAAAGAGDLGSGVFRELVVTGRSRLALFAARIPGGLGLLVPLVAIAVGIETAAAVGFAGSLAAPSAALLAKVGLWVVLDIAFYFVVALGLASLLGSRAQTIAILLAWRLAVTPILLSIGVLGVGRDIVPQAAFEQLAPNGIADSVRQAGTSIPMATGTAVVVLLAWVAVALGLGAWRTVTRDA
jgi:hypothetical protein